MCPSLARLTREEDKKKSLQQLPSLPLQIQGSLGMNALSATVAGIGTSMIIAEEISMYESAMWRSPYETVFTVSTAWSRSGNPYTGFV